MMHGFAVTAVKTIVSPAMHAPPNCVQPEVFPWKLNATCDGKMIAPSHGFGGTPERVRLESYECKKNDRGQTHNADL